MRKEFSDSIKDIALKDERIIFITGDLGFMAFEELRDALGHRFINAGVAEQNLVGVAAGLAKQGFLPIIYSIAPFIIYRCLEQIRNDIAFHNLPVIIVGNGGGYGYGIMGKTHHALEDYGIMGALNIKSVVPMLNSDVDKALNLILKENSPAYLRLGYGKLSENETVSEFSNWRKLSAGDKVTIVGIGPVSIQAYLASKRYDNKAELWVSGQYPVSDIPDALVDSINRTKNLICIEEHVKTGGFGENLVCKLIENGCYGFAFKSLYAVGYPEERYGSQQFHLKESNLDIESIYGILGEY